MIGWKFSAFLCAALGYGIAFGHSIGTSVVASASGASADSSQLGTSWPSAWTTVMLTGVGLLCGGAACCCLAMDTGGLQNASVRSPTAPFRTWLGIGASRGVPTVSAGWWLLGLAGAYWLDRLLVSLSVIDGAPAPHEPVGPAVLHAVCAGVGEELLVLSLPVLVIRALFGTRVNTGVGLGLLLVALVLLRVAYHLYYGPIGWNFALWALVAAVAFLRFRCAWPMIVVHAANDSFLVLQNNGVLGELTVVVVLTVAAGVLLAVGGFAMRRTHGAEDLPVTGTPESSR